MQETPINIALPMTLIIMEQWPNQVTGQTHEHFLSSGAEILYFYTDKGICDTKTCRYLYK